MWVYWLQEPSLNASLPLALANSIKGMMTLFVAVWVKAQPEAPLDIVEEYSEGSSTCACKQQILSILLNTDRNKGKIQLKKCTYRFPPT